MSLKHLMQRITSTNGIDIPDSENLRVPAGEIRAAITEADALRRECDELAARLEARLLIVVGIEHGEVWVSPPGSYDGESTAHDGTEPDKLQAYCEAITLCAAAIGRRMREGGR